MEAAPVEALALVLVQDAQLPAQRSKTLTPGCSILDKLPHRSVWLLPHSHSCDADDSGACSASSWCVLEAPQRLMKGWMPQIMVAGCSHTMAGRWLTRACKAK